MQFSRESKEGTRPQRSWTPLNIRQRRKGGIRFLDIYSIRIVIYSGILNPCPGKWQVGVEFWTDFSLVP